MKLNKFKRVLSYFVAVIMLVSVFSFIAPPQTVLANSVGVVFPYLYSGYDWSAGYNQDSGPGTFVEVNMNQEGIYSFQLTWTRDDYRWRGDGAFLVFLRPNGFDHVNVELNAISINGHVYAANRAFGRAGTFWNNASTMLFGRVPVPAGTTVSEINGYRINTLGVGHTMGPINAGDIVEIAIRVGPRPVLPPALHGDIDGSGSINSADVTMLRRFIATDNKPWFISNTSFTELNSNIGGLGVGSSGGLNMLRRHVASTLPTELGIPDPNYFIAFTFDDGPNGGGGAAHMSYNVTGDLLDVLNQLNTRNGQMCTFAGKQIYVVCGRNGIDPCPDNTPGCPHGWRGGIYCGNQSRVQVTFYPMGEDGFVGGEAYPNAATQTPAFIRRMLTDGHAICNHTNNHNTGLSTGIVRPGPNGFDNHGQQRSTPEYIINQINLLDTRIRGVTNGHGDFYGNQYSASNPHQTFSFRPNNFSMPMTAHLVDRNVNRNRDNTAFIGQPWIFGMIDPWDWTGHAAQFMSDFIVEGALAWCGGSPNGQQDCVNDGVIRRCPVRAPNIDEQGWTVTVPQMTPPPPGAIPSWSWCAIRNSTYTGAADGGADGAVVLLHDGGMGWNRRPTVDVMRTVVPRLQALGYHLVTVEQLFYYMDAEPTWAPTNMLPLWRGSHFWNKANPRNPGQPDGTAGRGVPPYWCQGADNSNGTGCGTANCSCNNDDRLPLNAPREGQGSQFGVNGAIRRGQGDRAGWLARTGYIPTRIYRDGGHRPAHLPATTPPR
jgi:peptidoglycan/xylan/chitin deacetylase (PgdA/CDA1 family)